MTLKSTSESATLSMLHKSVCLDADGVHVTNLHRPMEYQQANDVTLENAKLVWQMSLWRISCTMQMWPALQNSVAARNMPTGSQALSHTRQSTHLHALRRLKQDA